MTAMQMLTGYSTAAAAKVAVLLALASAAASLFLELTAVDIDVASAVTVRDALDRVIAAGFKTACLTNNVTKSDQVDPTANERADVAEVMAKFDADALAADPVRLNALRAQCATDRQATGEDACRAAATPATAARAGLLPGRRARRHAARLQHHDAPAGKPRRQGIDHRRAPGKPGGSPR
mgnify:CR=1 FL=1